MKHCTFNPEEPPKFGEIYNYLKFGECDNRCRRVQVYNLPVFENNVAQNYAPQPLLDI